MDYRAYLILRERLRQGLSQKELCRGICAVSYLSKIESGKAEPSGQIIRLLMERLGIASNPAEEEAARALAERGTELLLSFQPAKLKALLDSIGVALLLTGQGMLSLLASLTESFISLDESGRKAREPYSLSAWAGDLKAAAQCLRQERGLRSIYEYMAVTNGVASGFAPILVAFFRSFPGMTAAMYSLFSVVESRAAAWAARFSTASKSRPEKKYGFVFLVYQVYEFMDMCLLWPPYPLMLINRGLCGFLGSNSAILRNAAVQRYIPENLRARVNAFNNVMITAGSALFALLIGLLGEVIDYRRCLALGGAIAMAACWLLIHGRRRDIRRVYEKEPPEQAQEKIF